MHRFEIYSGSSLVGWSELESGDPPMGVAFGQFIPSPEYASIQPTVLASMNGVAPQPSLSVRLADGTPLQSTAGVHIADHSAEVGAEGIEVSILGLSHPQYESLFPEQVAAYQRHFGAGA